MSTTEASLDADYAPVSKGGYATSHNGRPGNRAVPWGTPLTRGDTDDAPIGGATVVSMKNSWIARIGQITIVNGTRLGLFG